MDKLIMQSGGFPQTTKTWLFLQKSLSDAIKGLTAFGGDTYILSGVEKDSPTTVTAGTIVYNGEVLPFVASDLNATVSIIETIEQVAYNEDIAPADGVLDPKDGYVTRFAICGSGLDDSVAEFPFDDLKTPFHRLFSTYLANVPLIYTGEIADIPKGFALCDGENGTPDMRSAFVVGYNPDEIDYDRIGNTGGEKDVTLTEGQMPQHNHNANFTIPPHKHNLPNPVYTKVGGSGDDNTFSNSNNTGKVDITQTLDSAPQNVSLTTANKGSSEAHENRPPYYVVAYMMYVGN